MLEETGMNVAPLLDISKPKEDFRNYESSINHSIVKNHYKDMRTNQTISFVKQMHEKYSFDPSKIRAKMTIREAFKSLESYVDSSDPDVSLPNMIHMFQTAEGIRKACYPDWFQLVGLIHDMGKIMFLWGDEKSGQCGTAEGPQWALGGDTWVVGAKIPDVVVFPEFNQLNPDMNDNRYNTDLGIYEEGCGLDNLLFAYGHDEYLYQMLVILFLSLQKAFFFSISISISSFPFCSCSISLHYQRKLWP
jgi:inositol oxygenase